MKEKKMTIALNDKDLKKLEEKYKCNREVLDRALEYALAQFKENINFNLHDDVSDADHDRVAQEGRLRDMLGMN